MFLIPKGFLNSFYYKTQGRMKRVIKNNVVPYYSSYEHDRPSLSALIVLFAEIKKRGYDVEIGEISKNEVERVESMNRPEWYETAKQLGFFSVPEKRMFHIYANIYEEIKKCYKEKRRSLCRPYWLRYFYYKTREEYVLKPREECMEILRSLPCPTYCEIEKKIFPETEKQKKLRELITDYLDAGNKYIPYHEFLNMLKSAGYASSKTNVSHQISEIVQHFNKKLGVNILILNHNRELRLFLKNELINYSKKFGKTITRRELVKIAEQAGYSKHTFQKISSANLKGLCGLLESEIKVVKPKERTKEIMCYLNERKITPAEAAEILSVIFLLGKEKTKILEYLLERKRRGLPPDVGVDKNTKNS
ncbi:MAG: hypothetical protein ACPL06_02670 [Candidatus Anstonellales archaeon]